MSGGNVRIARLSRLACVLVLASTGLAAAEDGDAPAESEGGVRVDTPFTGERDVQLEIYGGVGWYGPGVAVGLRINIPLLHNGFVDEINNAIFATFGGEFYYARYTESGQKELGPGFGIPFGLMRAFYFSERWSAFFEIGLNIYFPASFLGGGDFVDDAGGWVLVGVGGRWHFSERGALTVRLGTPSTSVGLMLDF